jgi:hypothetical protein
MQQFSIDVAINEIDQKFICFEIEIGRWFSSSRHF